MVILMYHELEAEGRRVIQDIPGYLRYVVRATDFRAQMEQLKEERRQGVNIGEALRFKPSTVAITFDDGCETDLIVAAPILRTLDFGATFYITVGFLGKPGYLSRPQLRELSSLGFQIGCHSMSHPYLSDLEGDDLRREIVDAKLQLEEIIGKAVEHFSCPGGRYGRRTIDMVRSAGYETMATSRYGSNSAAFADPFELGRIAVMRSTTLRKFQIYCHGKEERGRRIRESLRKAAQQLLGNRVYDYVRETLLRSSLRG